MAGWPLSPESGYTMHEWYSWTTRPTENRRGPVSHPWSRRDMVPCADLTALLSGAPQGGEGARG